MTDHAPSPEVLTAHVGDEAVLLHVGSKRYFRLNGTGAVLWRALEAGEGAEAIVRRLRDRFDVSEGQARTEATRFCEALRAAGLLTVAERR